MDPFLRLSAKEALSHPWFVAKVSFSPLKVAQKSMGSRVKDHERIGINELRAEITSKGLDKIYKE